VHWACVPSDSCWGAAFPMMSQSSGQVRQPRHRRIAPILAITLALVALLIWSGNYLLVSKPIRTELNSDSRNASFHLVGHYRYHVDISTLVLDLRRVEAVAPADLFRGLFQSAKAMHESGRSFTRVILARSRGSVFLLKGHDFRELGREYSQEQNSVYLIRTLPEMLFMPSGEPAFGSWTGGLLGVLGRQMEDATQAASTWANGR
jgi:hypothetical protein